MKLNDFGKTNLSEFINHYFTVPNYQRDYAWDEENIKDFFDDIKYAKKQNTEHFLGQIVLNAVPSDENNETYCIIDGQQRITTIFIFLKVIYDKLNSLLSSLQSEEAGLSRGISRVMINLENKVFGESCLKPNLVVGSENSQFFLENIMQGKPPKYKKNAPIKRARRLYSEAYYYFDEELGKYKEKETDIMLKDSSAQVQLSILNGFSDCVLENIYVMYLKTYKLNEAFVIFETLNARGRDLAASDLLKNKIMTYISESNAPVQLEKWNNFIDILGPSIEPTKFIRSYWNSIEQFTREKQLYRNISDKVESESDSVGFIKELNEMAPVYHDIAVASGFFFFFSDDSDSTVKEIQKYLDYLRWLGAKTFFPVILAMTRKDYSNADILSVLKKIEVYIFRNFTICGEVANNAEVFFAGVAKSITGDLDPSDPQFPCTTAAIERAISDKIANNTKFEDGLKTGAQNLQKMQFDISSPAFTLITIPFQVLLEIGKQLILNILCLRTMRNGLT